MNGLRLGWGPGRRGGLGARGAGRALVLVLALAFAAPLRAAELSWPGRPFQTVANEKKLVELLRELAASQGTTVVIDPKVEGLVSGRFAVNGPGGARKVLEDLTASHGLTWYFDGTLLYVEPASEAREDLIPITPDSAPRIQAALQRLRIGDKRFPLQISAPDGQVFVAGPRRYVEAVRQVVRSVDVRNTQRDRSEVRLFTLRFAWAQDVELRRAAGRAVTVPGVVSVLRGLFDPRRGGATGTPAGSDTAGSSGALPRVGASRTLRLPSGALASAPRLDLPGAEAEGFESALPGGATPVDLPQFQADSRMNAVLVRDLPERMDMYARLIEQMDRRPRLVEIEVQIMDISHDGLDRLGVDWRAHGSRLDLQTGNGGAPALTWAGVATTAGQTGPTAPIGALLSAAIGHEARNFLLARVSALAAEGKASFVARPKLLTLDNTEAALENKSEFFVRVNGFQDSSLYQVVAGTDLRVTPLIVDEGQGRGVVLSINIGDDTVSSELVDNVPVVRRRSVTTQALVEEGRSVLLAGYTTEERRDARTGVPLLSSLPLVGGIFRYTEKQRANVERFYLVTPRMAGADAAAAAANAANPANLVNPASPVPGGAPAPAAGADPIAPTGLAPEPPRFRRSRS